MSLLLFNIMEVTEGGVKLKINTTTIISCKHILWRELGIFCEPLCSANFHGILYIYICNVVPCSTETNTEFVNHLLKKCKTTFNKPFGQYRWNQMPFGVCSAPEVWQRNEFVEDLEGVEVIADDFLIAGFGIGDWEVNNNLKKTWAHFSQEIPLVEPEIESCRSETAPVKHEIHGSAAHLSGPEKIQAILQMPEPKDVTALKRFLGMVTYLAKFMPHLSDTSHSDA